MNGHTARRDVIISSSCRCCCLLLLAKSTAMLLSNSLFSIVLTYSCRKKLTLRSLPWKHSWCSNALKLLQCEAVCISAIQRKLSILDLKSYRTQTVSKVTSAMIASRLLRVFVSVESFSSPRPRGECTSDWCSRCFQIDVAQGSAGIFQLDSNSSRVRCTVNDEWYYCSLSHLAEPPRKWIHASRCSNAHSMKWSRARYWGRVK